MFTISDTVKGWLYKLVFVLLVSGLLWQCYEIFDAKNKRIEDLGAKVTALEAKNKQLEEDIAKKSKSETVTVIVKEEIKKEEVKLEKAKTEANKYVDKKLAEIEQKYSAMDKTPANEERKRVEISLERAKGLWLTFCLQEPEEKACKK